MTAKNQLATCLRQMVFEDMGLSAEGFARKLNVSVKTVERWMRGEGDDPFFLLQAWNVAPENWKLKLLPFIATEIVRWGATFRRLE
jgi:transcriptional regulator with XRE-family HTH domain